MDTNLGGKAQSLIWLERNGFAPPSFSVFGTEIWKTLLLHRLDITDLMQRLEYTTEELARKVISATLREKLKQIQLPVEVITQVQNEFTQGKFGNCAVVRSSAISEDSITMSSAGQYETVLGLSNVSDILMAIKTVLASYFGDRAVMYRHHKKIPQNSLDIAVIVQQMIFADISGIAFSQDPVGQHKNACVIDASWGLGSVIVSGEVKPDNYIVDDSQGVISKQLGTKKFLEKYDFQAQKLIKISSTKLNEYCLTDKEAIHLATIVRKAETLKGFPVDVEWVAMKNHDHQFTIVQIRAITGYTKI